MDTRKTETAPEELKTEALDDVAGGMFLMEQSVMGPIEQVGVNINNDHHVTDGVGVNINNDHRVGNWA